MEKLFISTQKYSIVGPRKVRGLTALIKNLKPLDAVTKLMFVNKKPAEILAKVIKTAVAQGKVAGVADTDLVFKEIQIGEGPRLKRGHPVSRGMWHPYKKRMSHIRIVLTTRKSETLNPKSKKHESQS